MGISNLGIIPFRILISKQLQHLEYPLYCISTRDSFAFDLITRVEYVELGGRTVKK